MTAPAPPLRVSAESRGGWMVVVVAGEVDYQTCPELTAALEPVLEGQQRPRVAIDLSGLGFCDSSGLRCLVAAWKRVRGRDGQFLLLRPPGAFRRRIELAGLGGQLRSADSLPG